MCWPFILLLDKEAFMKSPWLFDPVFYVNLLIRNVIRDAVYIKEKGKVEGQLIIISKKLSI